MIEKEQFEELIKLQRKISQDVNSISRAIYGDELNKVPGLIDRQLQDEDRIKKLEDAKKKFMWIAAGFILAFQAVKEFVLKILN